MRPGIFITGTDTCIGKTVVAAGLAGALRQRGIDVGVMKPVETGATKKGKRLIPQDAEFLMKVSQVKDSLSLVNPYCWEAPLAPSLASHLAGVRLAPQKIVNSFRRLRNAHQFIIVEGAGGLLVPLTDDYLVSDLIRELDLPLIVVARPGLGTINHTLLTVEYARKSEIEVIGVIINYSSRKEEGICEETNPGIISCLGRVTILGIIPYLEGIDVEGREPGNLVETVSEEIDLDSITEMKSSTSPLDRETENSVGVGFIRPATKGVINAAPTTLKSPYNKVKQPVPEGTGGGKSPALSLKELDKLYVWHPFTQMKDWLKEEPLIIEEGRGSYLKDEEGRWYLDGVSSLWVNLHGHHRKELDEAVQEQLGKVAHSTLLGLSNVPSIQLAERLAKISPPGLSKVFYSDNGSTAVEIALKIAFQYWQQKSERTKKKIKFISLENAYHGDTLGAVSVGGIDLFHRLYRPFLFDSFRVNSPYCYRCSLSKGYPGCRLACLGELEKVMEREKGNIAALIIEPLVQAAAGILISPPGYLKGVRELCRRYEVLMIADEVATGFGRTGRMFACEHEGVSPDILILAKGITGGYLPLAATLTTEDIYEAFLGEYSEKKTFFHGHTYTGNPLACTVALANLNIFEKEKVLDNLPPKIRFLQDELENFKSLEHVGEVRQKGMMVGIELVADKERKNEYPYEDKIGIKVIQEARKRGLIIRPLGNVIVLLPPLSVSLNELQEIADITRESIEKITQQD